MQLVQPSEAPPLTTAAVARIAGASRVTIIRAIQSGDLGAVRLGPRGSYRVTREALDAWLRPVVDEPEDAA